MTSDPASRRLGAWVGLLLLGAGLFLAGNGRYGVYDRDEARFALAVREMLERGDPWVPTNWGRLRFQKPILIYWAAGASARAFGLNEFALRLPSALAALLVVAMTVAAARPRLGERVAWRAGVVLATSLFFVVEAKACTADALLLLGTTASFWAWWQLLSREARLGRWRLLLWVGVGVGLLAKLVNAGFLLAAACAWIALAESWSPRARRLLVAGAVAGAVASAIPGLSVLGAGLGAALALALLAAAARSGRLRAGIVRSGALWGAPLALAMFATWAVPALIATHGAFFRLGIRHEMLGQATRPFEGHVGVPGFYAFASLVALFPWAPLLPAAVARRGRELLRPADLGFLGAWILGPWVLLELTASKLPHYLLVTAPALAMLVASEIALRARSGSPPRRAVRILEASLLVLPCLALAGVGIFLALRFDVDGVRGAGIVLAVAALGFAATGGSVLARGRTGRLFATLLTGALVLYGVAYEVVLPRLEGLRIARPLAAAVARELRPGDRLLIHKFRHESVGFALPRLPERIDDPDRLARVLTAIGRRALLIVPNGPHERRLDTLLERHPIAVERVAVVRGRILPRLREHEVWLVRVRGGELSQAGEAKADAPARAGHEPTPSGSAP